MQQRLMRDLHAPRLGAVTTARGDQPLVGQCADDRLDLTALVAGRHQLVEVDPPTCVLRALSGLHEPEQEAFGHVALLWRQRVVDRLGMLGERSCTPPLST